jgi:hypothetical protein
MMFSCWVMFSCWRRRVHSVTPQAGSVLGHQTQRERWSILYRLRSGMSPSLDWAGPSADFIRESGG